MSYALAMRRAWILLLVVLAGCPADTSCAVDEECADGEVCARDHACTSGSQVREVRANWTINGGPANTGVCADRDLYIEFRSQSPDDRVQFRPVPCFVGQFTVDKLPNRMDTVELGVEGAAGRDIAEFDTDGVAQLDLTF